MMLFPLLKQKNFNLMHYYAWMMTSMTFPSPKQWEQTCKINKWSKVFMQCYGHCTSIYSCCSPKWNEAVQSHASRLTFQWCYNSLNWCAHVNGASIFPKLPLYLWTYCETWERNQHVCDSAGKSQSGLQVLRSLNDALSLPTSNQDETSPIQQQVISLASCESPWPTAWVIASTTRNNIPKRVCWSWQPILFLSKIASTSCMIPNIFATPIVAELALALSYQILAQRKA